MAQVARKVSEEYWRPANSAAARVAQPILAESVCPRCSVEYAMGARFCHVCGNERDPRPKAPPRQLTFADWFDMEVIRQRLRLSVPCLVFLIVAVANMIIAAALGLMYKAETLPDWQAVQVWRIEWLLGAAVALLVAILLKTTD